MTKGSWCDLEHTKPFVCCVTVYSLSTRFVTGVTVVTPAHVYVRETLWLFTTRYCVYILFIKWTKSLWIQIFICAHTAKFNFNLQSSNSSLFFNLLLIFSLHYFLLGFKERSHWSKLIGFLPRLMRYCSLTIQSVLFN